MEAGLSRSEQLRRQRGNLKQRLGLGGPMDSLMDTDQLFGDEDLMATEDSKSEGGGGGRSRPAQQQKQQEAPGEHKDAQSLLADMSGLSARERAAALRRQKSLKRSASSVVAGPSPPKKAKGAGSASAVAATPGKASEAGGSQAAADAEVAAAAAEEAEAEWADILQGGRWPFQSLCDQLCVDVLHPCWEVRHGAALALREVLRSQAGAAGVHAPVAAQPGGWAAGGGGKLALGPVSSADAAAAAAANAGWLEDCAIHLLCVLALDRFGDFVSDQVRGGDMMVGWLLLRWRQAGWRRGAVAPALGASSPPSPSQAHLNPVQPPIPTNRHAGGGPCARDSGTGAGRSSAPAAAGRAAVAAGCAAPAQRIRRRVGGAARWPAGA